MNLLISSYLAWWSLCSSLFIISLAKTKSDEEENEDVQRWPRVQREKTYCCCCCCRDRFLDYRRQRWHWHISSPSFVDFRLRRSSSLLADLERDLTKQKCKWIEIFAHPRTNSLSINQFWKDTQWMSMCMSETNLSSSNENENEEEE